MSARVKNPVYDVRVYSKDGERVLHDFTFEAKDAATAEDVVREALRKDVHRELYRTDFNDVGAIIALDSPSIFSEEFIEENPNYRVSLSVPSVNESTEVSALTETRALKKGRRKLKSKERPHPEYSVKRNSDYPTFIIELKDGGKLAVQAKNLKEVKRLVRQGYWGITNKDVKRVRVWQSNPMHPLETVSHVATAIMGTHSAIDLYDKHVRPRRRRRNPGTGDFTIEAEGVDGLGVPFVVFSVYDSRGNWREVDANYDIDKKQWTFYTPDGEGVALFVRELLQNYLAREGAYLLEENPLRKGAAFASSNIRELHHGKQYKRTRARYGEDAAHRQAIAAGLHAAGISRNPVKFRDLSIGDEFDFVSGSSVYDSFYDRCVKTGKRTYKSLDTGQAYKVGSVSAFVYNVSRKNSYKRTPQTPLHVHDYEAERYGHDIDVTDYYRGKRGKGAHPRVHPTPRPNSLGESFVNGLGFGAGTGVIAGVGLAALHKLSKNPLTPDRLLYEARIYQEEAATLHKLAKATRDRSKRSKLMEEARYYNKLAKQRVKDAKAMKNPNARIPSHVNQFSRMFHGKGNRHYGKVRNSFVSSRVRTGEYLGRLGTLPYIKLKNPSANRSASCNSPKHACKACSIMMRPNSSFLAATGANGRYKLAIAGKGALAQGRALRRLITRQNPDARDAVIDLGEIEVIGYLTEEKHSDSGEPILYYHETAEETHRIEDMPHLKIDEEGMLFIPTSGEDAGNYSIDERGIIN